MVLPTYMASMQQLQQMGLATYSPLTMTQPTFHNIQQMNPSMTIPSLSAVPSTVASLSSLSSPVYTTSLTNGHSGGSVSPQSTENHRESPTSSVLNPPLPHDSPPPPPSLDEVNLQYLKELETEKESLEECSDDSLLKSQALKLLEQEISRIQSGGNKNGGYKEPVKYFDIYRERPIRLTIRALVPVREHPKFNFVGKLLGPKGNSMKRLQEETMTKMAVLGRGSMRDKQKEEDLRLSNDPKYQHLHEELHVEITAFAPPAEAHARIAYALTEVRKYLIPDSNDDIRQEQMREMEVMCNTGGDPTISPTLAFDPLKQVAAASTTSLNSAIAGLRSPNLTLTAAAPQQPMTLNGAVQPIFQGLAGVRQSNGYIASPYLASGTNLQMDSTTLGQTPANNLQDQYNTSSTLVDPTVQWHNLKAPSSMDTSKHRLQASPYTKPI